jgi:hypothetical protein
LIYFIIVVYDILDILRESEEHIGSFDTFLEFLLNSIELKSEQYKKNNTYFNLTLLQNYTIFFMIMTLSLKEYPEFIFVVFNGETNFFHKLIEILTSHKKREQLLMILNNLFLTEYEEIFYRKDQPDPELEQLFIEEKIYFNSFYQNANILHPEEEYINLFQRIFLFDISYKDFFPNELEDMEINMDSIELDEKISYKLTIVQSLIRVIFSHEKRKYINEKFYEFKVLKQIIDKDITETRKKYGDQYKTLFRKEDICDDFLKYIFFIFGNKMMVESFVKPIKKDLYKIGFKNRGINIDEFKLFINTFLRNLKNTLPNILKVLLKLLYESVKSHFTIEEDNYGPLYTTLMFNYFINPKVQSIFNINGQKSIYVRSLNRILRNIMFNSKFSDGDDLRIFNDIMEENHLKIKEFFKKNIIDINLEDDGIKGSLENIMTGQYSVYPNFLFYLDCNILLEGDKSGKNEFILYEQKRLTIGEWDKME